MQKKKTKPLKKSIPSNKTHNEQNSVTKCNQTSTQVAQEDMEVGLNADQIASNDSNDNQQDSDVSSIATVGAVDQAANRKRKRVVIKLRPKKKTKKNSYEVDAKQ